jgi:hypothetical protein
LILALLADGEGALAKIAFVVVLSSVAALTAIVGLAIWVRRPAEHRSHWTGILCVAVLLVCVVLLHGIFFAPNFLTRRL